MYTLMCIKLMTNKTLLYKKINKIKLKKEAIAGLGQSFTWVEARRQVSISRKRPLWVRSTSWAEIDPVSEHKLNQREWSVHTEEQERRLEAKLKKELHLENFNLIKGETLEVFDYVNCWTVTCKRGILSTRPMNEGEYGLEIWKVS